MNEINAGGDYLGLFVLAACCGAAGGLANELLQTIRGRTGNLRLWNYSKAGRLFNIGFVGPLFLGAVAAVVLLIFVPFPERPLPGSTTGETIRSYDPLRIVPLSLAAGVAGSAVLMAAQARLLALVSEQRVELVGAAAKEQIERTATEAWAEASRAVEATLDQEVRPRVAALLAKAEAAVPPWLAGSLAERGVEEGVFKAAMAAAAVPKAAALGQAAPAAATVMPELDDLFGRLRERLDEGAGSRVDQQVEAAKSVIDASMRAASPAGRA